MREQFSKSNSRVFGCPNPKCTRVMSQEDRENIRDAYIDMLEVHIADLTKLAEDLNARLLVTEAALRESEAARIADRAYFDAQYELWKAERTEMAREHALELSRVRAEMGQRLSEMARDRDEMKRKFDASETDRLIAFQTHSNQIATMQTQIAMLMDHVENRSRQYASIAMLGD